MKRTSVQSRAIRSVGFEPETRTLEVEFHSGRVYQYLDVAPSLERWLMRSNDKGGLLNRLVIKKHVEREVTPAAEPQDLLALLEASLNKNPPE